MENTIENKAKFFAQYWGQKIVRSILPEQKIHLSNVDCEKFRIPHLIINSHLELKPLSSISDEDAKELHKISKCDDNEAGYDTSWKRLKESVVKDGYFGLTMFCFYIDELRYADWLRCNGYALDWNGITVEQQIEYGWVKLK